MIRGAFARLRQGLRRTRSGLVGRLSALFGGGRVRLDAGTLDQIEELLLGADMGVAASLRITRTIETRLREAGGEASLSGVLEVIRTDARDMLVNARPKVRPPGWEALVEAEAGGGAGAVTERPGGGRRRKKERSAAFAAASADAIETAAPGAVAVPEVILVVGVNGTGKTTSIAKLAALEKERGRSVLLAAADTFRAAAVEQLAVWAERVGVPCVQQGQGADPAAVVYDALAAASARGHDLVIVDTAGRLHTKTNLMAELAKIARVILKRTGRAPQTLLVVDANTGQNGLAQARIFAETIPIDGLVLAKLDGTAKGGIVVAIAEELGLPVRYVGTGETAADLAEFDVETFLEALFADWQAEEADGDDDS